MREELKSGLWLTDEHIGLAQELLEKDYPQISGFQCTLLSQNDGFVPVKSDSDALQFHHTNGNHWVLSTTIGGEVTVVDSNWQGHMNSSLTHQLAQIYRAHIDSQEDDGDVTFLSVHIPRVQQQSGGSDCGLFAIAFAVHILGGNNIEDIEFNQGKMRSHLNSCFWKKKLLPFPTLNQTGHRQTQYFPYTCVDIYCYCKMPETYGDMVQCDECDEWYHIRCVPVDKRKISAKWLCKTCNVDEPSSNAKINELIT